MIQADQLYVNGTVLTLDEDSTRAGSVAVRDGNIVGVWEASVPAQDQVSHDVEVIDLKGHTMIPGFIDTHNHLFMYSQTREHVNCATPPNQTIQDILMRVRAQAEVVEVTEWIMGWGYDDTLLQDSRHITRGELDRVAPHHPVFIRHISGHLAVVNSKALEIAGVPEDIENPSGGHFGRDENGYLDGVLYEFPVLDYLFSSMPELSVEALTDKINRAATDYLKQGITTNTDAGVGLDLGMKEYETHTKALEEGKNPLRMRFMMLHHLVRDGGPFDGMTAEEMNEKIMADSNGRATLDSAKLFQDGSIQGLTGALREPYTQHPDVTGDLVFDQQLFNDMVQELHDRGFRVATHGNGDRAIGSIIEAYTNAIDQNKRQDHRHRIEHVQTGSQADLDKMNDYNIAASFFINHVYYWGDRHRDIFLGEARASRMNPVAEAVERDMLYTLHSDNPITAISPLFSIWAAVNRVTRSGRVLGEEQKISVDEALKSMTIYGAELNFEEEIVGSIEQGKRADFAILDQDPTKIEPMEIKDIGVVATIIGGKREFDALS
ncbi:amidohydrolase family protein [Pontibacillus yanchengensis]|uniref:Amidohydrolase family protein n=2 Tax=Pontibacillus yanchengensis TaxID=462910 RepID=A0ACC7VEE9_9BACI|nr:amidohydrolase [Pontibacillus yanchengensis]MYL34350.1 amidohydrolase family protein [Pontibacillus yanchengensis]MYL53818.1 amidohydrolase family protein [Pontibacillus yanchengensis]